MLKNKFMSAAAAVVLATTSGLAYDSTSTGKIVAYKDATAPAGYNPNLDLALAADKQNTFTDANITGGVNAENNLTLSTTQFGDALIYPAFREDDYWNTEITVGNSSEDAIVAKVVLYAADDSREIIDFNIYLSGKDVYTFNITKMLNPNTGEIERAIESKDKSLIQKANVPSYKATGKSYQETDASAGVLVDDTKTFSFNNGSLKDVASGYVVVYAMAQSESFPTEKTLASGDKYTLAYHNNHAQLFLDYRIALDTCRDGWRDSFTAGGMYSGMPTKSVKAPNLNENCDDDNNNTILTYRVDGTKVASTETERKDAEMVNFFSPKSDVLYGSVKITSENTADLGARDLIIPAKAIANFTDENVMMLWSEGEYASIQDRRIESGDDNLSSYDTEGIINDSKAFTVNTAYYTFGENDITNSILITQPYKRILTQLGHDKAEKDLKLDSTYPYGGFHVNLFVFNENEQFVFNQTEVGSTIITSPYEPGALPESSFYFNELQSIRDLEKSNGSFQTLTDDGTTEVKNGFVEIKPTLSISGEKTISAIITQMTGTSAEGEPQTNWVYAPVK